MFHGRQSRARHAARRDPSDPTRSPARTRAVLLPGVLLLAGGSAFGGMAVLPAAADDTPAPVAAPHAETVAAPPAHANVALLATLERGVATATAQQAAARKAVRASRARRAAPPRPAAAPAPQFVRPGAGRLTSPYGPRWGRLHGGIDLAAGTGSPIRAVTRGTVLSAGDEGGYGRLVRLQHGGGTVSVYAHLSDILVRVGQPVRAGEVIGREGSTGHSTGPHLHFEVRVGDVPVDPAAWLRARGVAV